MTREERKAAEAAEGATTSKEDNAATTPYTMKLPAELHRKLKAEAVLNGLTINEVIKRVLEEHLQGS
jgi:predicted HicB family RNase H-like nuclease